MVIILVTFGSLCSINNPEGAKQNRRYRLPGATSDLNLFSKLVGKQDDEAQKD